MEDNLIMSKKKDELIIDGKKFELFDTAGQRSKQGKIEKYGYKIGKNIPSEENIVKYKIKKFKVWDDSKRDIYKKLIQS